MRDENDGNWSKTVLTGFGFTEFSVNGLIVHAAPCSSKKHRLFRAFGNHGRALFRCALAHSHKSLIVIRVKILVTEDQTMSGELLASACAQAIPGSRVCNAGDGAAAITAARELIPDLVILDLVLPDCDGLALTKELFAISPSVKIVVLSSHLDEFTLHRVANSRVHGIIHKNEHPAAFLREAIDTVMAGRQYYSPIVQSLRASLRADPAAFNKILSDREQEVLGLIGEGFNDETIAERLGFTARTAKAHRVKLMAKLNMHSTPQLIRYALEKGFARITPRTPGA